MRKQISEGRRKTLGTSDHGIDEGSKVSRSEDLVEYHHLSPAMAGCPFTDICAPLSGGEARYAPAAGMSTIWGSPYKTAVELPSVLLSSPTTCVTRQVLPSMTLAVSLTEVGQRQRSEVRSPKIGRETHSH